MAPFFVERKNDLKRRLKKPTGRINAARWMIRCRQVAVLAAVIALALPAYVYAEEDITTAMTSLTDLVMKIVQLAGGIVIIWGVFEFASGYQSHDGTQQTAGLKRVVAGLLMFFAGSVLSAMGVSV